MLPFRSAFFAPGLPPIAFIDDLKPLRGLAPCRASPSDAGMAALAHYEFSSRISMGYGDEDRRSGELGPCYSPPCLRRHCIERTPLFSVTLVDDFGALSVQAGESVLHLL